MPEGRSPPPRRRLRRFLSSIICRNRIIDLDEESHRVPVYFTSLEGPLPSMTNADWLSDGMTESKQITATPATTTSSAAAAAAAPPFTTMSTCDNTHNNNNNNNNNNQQHHQHRHHHPSLSSEQPLSHCSTSSFHKNDTHNKSFVTKSPISSNSNEGNNLTRFVKRSLTGHRKRFSKSRDKKTEDSRHSVDFHKLSTYPDVMPAPITRRQRALTDTSLSEMPWGTMKTSDTPSTSGKLEENAAAMRTTATTGHEEVHETDLAAIPSELKSPTVPPRALTLRLRGSRESAASSSTSIAAINVNHPANSSISHQHQHTHDLAVSSIIVGSDHQEMGIPTSMHLPVPPAMSSQSQVSLVSASSMESRASYRAVPSPAGTFGQPGTWWARGRRSIGDSSCAVSIISLGSAFYPGEGGNNHATINGLRKGSMDQSADSSCRVSISSVTGNISGSAGTGMATATPTATSGNRSKSGYVHSLLAVRPMVRNERPHSVELPASPTSAGGYRDPHFNDVRMEQRRAITSWHV